MENANALNYALLTIVPTILLLLICGIGSIYVIRSTTKKTSKRIFEKILREMTMSEENPLTTSEIANALVCHMFGQKLPDDVRVEALAYVMKVISENGKRNPNQAILSRSILQEEEPQNPPATL